MQLGFVPSCCHKGTLNQKFTIAFTMYLKIGVMQHLKVKGLKVYILYIYGILHPFYCKV